MKRFLFLPALTLLALPALVNAALPDFTTGVVEVPADIHASEHIVLTVPVAAAGASQGFPVLLQVEYEGPKDPREIWWVGLKESNYVEPSDEVATWNHVFDWAGDYRLRACANHNVEWTAIAPEENYRNNCSPWQSFTVTEAPRPNLVVGGITLTQGPASYTVSLKASAHNIADASSGEFPVLFQIRDYFTTREVGSVEGSYVSGVDGWKHSEESSASFTFPQEGTRIYAVRACVNHNASWTAITPESNYGDNCSEWERYDAVAGPVVDRGIVPYQQP